MKTLLVEDDAVALAMMRSLLEKRGHEVTWHTDGLAAWQSFEREPFSLVISDWNLPGLDGIDLCRRIRQTEAGASSYVLAITGRDSDRDVRAMLKAGASDYALKPISAAVLDVRLRIAEYRITESLERRRAQDEVRRMRAVSELGTRALESLSLQDLLDDAVRSVAATLDAGIVTVTELQKRDGSLLLRAACGVDPALIGKATFPPGTGSQCGFTALKRVPVLLSHYPTESRFTPTIGLVAGDDITSGITVLVAGAEEPYGVLGAWSRRPNAFTPEDAAYLQSIANILAMAVRRCAAEEQFRQAQKMEAVGLLAGGVAHDFNNLLSAINGYSELLLISLPDDSAIRSELQEIHEAGERAASLTRQLLAFSRRQLFQPQNLDFNEVIRQMEKMLRRIIGEDVELVTELHGAPASVFADRSHLEQVVLNLAVNARDAMPEGGRLVVATSLRRMAEESGSAPPGVPAGTYVELRVEDTGCGMPPEVVARIFEPFFTTKEKDRGTGLGLSTVYGVVQQSSGHVRVESEPGRGTRFDILLPHVPTASSPRKGLKSAVLEKGTETVLLVEDDEHVRRLARRVLGDNGYTLIEARDGQEAIERFEAHDGPIHLLLTDLVMPRMSGKALADRLARPGLKVLFMSGYSPEMTGRQGPLPPDMRLLPKPLTPSVLSHEVRRVLDEAGAAGG